MKGIDREQDAYDEGRRAAMRGEATSQYHPTYRRRSALWARFLLGYNDELKLLAQARRHGDKCKHAGGGSK